MWHWGDASNGWGMLWMGLMMAIMWLPILVVLIWALRQFGRPPHEPGLPSSPSTEPDAREIARRSYARGDIDRERYLQIVQDLDETKG